MGQRDFGFLLVPFLALIALLLPSAGSSGKPDSELSGEPAAIEAPGLPSKSGSASALIAEYYGPLAAQSQLQAQECLIATLPDPIDAANLSYTYDRYIDAIQRAMEAAGFVLDRFDVPWLDKDTSLAGAQTGTGTAADNEPRFRKEPATPSPGARISG